MTVFDLVVLLVLVLSCVLGAWRGFAFELLSLLGWVLAFVLAVRWASAWGQWLLSLQWSWLSDAKVCFVLGFLLIFVLVVLGSAAVAKLMQKLLRTLGLRVADRALGALFGLLRAGVWVLVGVMVIHNTPLREQAWWQESLSAPWLLALWQQCVPVVKLWMAAISSEVTPLG